MECIAFSARYVMLGRIVQHLNADAPYRRDSLTTKENSIKVEKVFVDSELSHSESCVKSDIVEVIKNYPDIGISINAT